MTGTAEPRSIITVSKGIVVLGEAVTNQDGNFSFLLSTKQSAGTKLSVVSTDKAVNKSPATTLKVKKAGSNSINQLLKRILHLSF